MIPGEENQPLLAMRSRARCSPFYEATRRAGCTVYTIYNHMYMPLVCKTLEEDYFHLVEHAQLWDVASQRQVEITGPDASRLAQHLTPRNLSTLKPGRCRYALLTAADGTVINDPVALRLAENHYWFSLADSDALLWVEGLVASGDFNATVCEPDVSPLQLQGPKSPEVARELFGDAITGLGYFRFIETKLDGIPLVVSRTGWSGEHGYEIFLRDGSRGDELWERIMAAGKPHKIGVGGPNAIRRIEGGLLSWGGDITREDTPYHAGLGWTVDLNQEADFCGKEALRAVAARGVDRMLQGVEIDGGPLPASANVAPWPAFLNGEPAGRVTSCIRSPRLEKNIGLAMLPVEAAGTLTATAPDGTRSLTLAKVPFIEPLAGGKALS